MDLDSSRAFDETAQEAAEHLLEQFWILREREPDKYQMVREREPVLRSYFLEKLGFHLIVHPYFAKLEKIPVRPEPWMGIRDFQHPRDYALLCCLLAYLESKSVDEQFLMSELCEELSAAYPGEDGLDWTHYEHRRALVRVLVYAAELGILQVVEGDVAEFSNTEDYEVLYEVPAVSRYFMRSLPRESLAQRDLQGIAAPNGGEGDAEIGPWRRRRVYRQLFLSPVMYRWQLDESDFAYLRNYRQRIREDIESHTPFQFELYQHAALLTLPERRARFAFFPDNKAISDVALHFGGLIRELVEDEELLVDDRGCVRLTQVDYENLVDACRVRYGSGWSKQHREASVAATAQELKDLLMEWKMLEVEAETGMVLLLPLLARTIGRYPDDFSAE
ncbi:MAG: TIGR02678 family protein [Firmicutes bacterium]|nr:TIGR02678 family protein [Bacillota bacterium]